jgi:hypothetical protein
MTRPVILSAVFSAALLAMVPPYQQSGGFERVLGGEDLERGVFVSPTRDGGYVAVGVSQSLPEGDEDVYLVRTDSAGELLWSQTYGGNAHDNGWSVRETEDGFMIAGFTESFGSGGFDFYLLATDSRGEIVWSETYGGESDDRAWALAPASGGGFVLVGETKSFGAGEEDCFLVRTDDSGAELWTRTYGGEKGDRCFSVVETNDGGYMIAGQTYSEGAGDRDLYVLKTDVNGTLEWSKTFGGPVSDVGHYITATSDGSFVVTGYTTSLAADGDDPYLVKIDPDGEVQWTRVLPMAGVNHTLTGEQATDGGFYLVGFSEYPERGSNAALLVKADPEGRLDWHRDVLATETGRTIGYTVRAMSGGACVFTGHSTVGSAGGLDLLLVRVAGEKQ